jgi:hypothetical protein
VLSAPGVLVDTPGVDSKVQRLWSNRAAAASHDPCEPLGLNPYFNSAPVLGDIVMATDAAGHAFSTRGVHIAVGATRTVELDLFSDSPTAPWTLVGSDSAGFSCGLNPGVTFFGGGPPAPGADGGPAGGGPPPPVVPGPPPTPCLSYSFDRTQGKNGDKVHIAIKVNYPLPGGTALIMVQNMLGGATTQWPFLVVN